MILLVVHVWLPLSTSKKWRLATIALLLALRAALSDGGAPKKRKSWRSSKMAVLDSNKEHNADLTRQQALQQECSHKYVVLRLGNHLAQRILPRHFIGGSDWAAGRPPAKVPILNLPACSAPDSSTPSAGGIVRVIVLMVDQPSQ